MESRGTRAQMQIKDQTKKIIKGQKGKKRIIGKRGREFNKYKSPNFKALMMAKTTLK